MKSVKTIERKIISLKRKAAYYDAKPQKTTVNNLLAVQFLGGVAALEWVLKE